MTTKTSYEEIFGVPIPEGADEWQNAKHKVAMRRLEEASRLRILAAVNRWYAAEGRATFQNTGRGLYMAELREAIAGRQEAQAELIFPADDTAEYDTIGQVL